MPQKIKTHKHHCIVEYKIMESKKGTSQVSGLCDRIKKIRKKRYRAVVFRKAFEAYYTWHRLFI